MNSRESRTPDRDQTIARARATRAAQARAAAFYANRAEQARARARPTVVAEWTDGYRRAAATCRRLGETIRSDREAA
jgi:hypothetical protein